MPNRIRTTKAWLEKRAASSKNVGAGTKTKSYKFACGVSRDICSGASFNPLINKGEWVHGSADSARRCVNRAIRLRQLLAL